MEIKLGNFVEGDELTVTSGLHGLNQDGQAMDFIKSPSGVGRMIAQEDGEVTYEHKNKEQSYFNFKFLDGSFAQYVHALPTRLGEFKKGEFLGLTTYHHYHVGLFVKDVGWEPILEYMDRGIQLRQGVVNGEKVSIKWCRWSTYEDKYLNFNFSNYIVGDDRFTHEEWLAAERWNNEIGEKGYLKGNKLLNQVRDDRDRARLVNTWRFKNFIQETGGVNDWRQDELILRFAQYIKTSPNT